MKIKHTRQLKNGNRHLLVELKPNEEINVINEDLHYKLGYPIEDVVIGHVLAQAVPVSWCSLSQEWLS